MAARAVFGNQWDAIREQIDNSEPQEAADILRDFMLDPTRDKSEKSALLHYASKRITAQYYNAEEAKVRRQLLKEFD
jgi:hypothetical protein